ncbi:MAG: hypothetical protein ACR2NN_24665 [Bryobacteraceae bacterium]
MPNDIPQEQLDRIQPRVDQFLVAFRQLELAIPLDACSALTYQVER